MNTCQLLYPRIGALVFALSPSTQRYYHTVSIVMPFLREELDILHLDHDVIRNIIRIGLEDIDNMRQVSGNERNYRTFQNMVPRFQISPQWNGVAEEHLKNRSHLPVIKCFDWSIDYSVQRKISARIPARYQKYFGVKKWQIKPIGSDTLCENVSYLKICNVIS